MSNSVPVREDTQPPAEKREIIWPASRLLRDFETPREIADLVEADCRTNKFGPKERRRIEEDLKLSYYFGGQFVIVTRTPQGLMIHAVGLTDPDEAHAVRQRLREEGWQNVRDLFPERWEFVSSNCAYIGIITAG